MALPGKGRSRVIGVHFGTLSGPAVVVAVDDGQLPGGALHHRPGCGGNDVMNRSRGPRRKAASG